VDTLQALHQAYPGAAFYLLMGQDQAQRLGTWNRAEALPQLATLCVAARAESGAQWQEPEKAHGLQIPMPAMPFSSSAIRAAVAAAGDTSAMLAPAVARYIAQHRLYATILSTENPD
jgi:nicotinate-nucleotide adenylyltransferase